MVIIAYAIGRRIILANPYNINIDMTIHCKVSILKNSRQSCKLTIAGQLVNVSLGACSMYAHNKIIPSRFAIGRNGRMLPSFLKTDKAWLYPTQIIKLGATSPFKNSSQSGIK
jgi:hypothetical protein